MYIVDTILPVAGDIMVIVANTVLYVANTMSVADIKVPTANTMLSVANTMVTRGC